MPDYFIPLMFLIVCLLIVGLSMWDSHRRRHAHQGRHRTPPGEQPSVYRYIGQMA